MSNKKYHFFWRGPFSQWAASPFIDRNGIRFNCCEQWMMYCKANLFDDGDTAIEILQTDDPKEQKDLGRKVKNFNVEKWQTFRFGIVWQGNFYKFTQNPDLQTELLQTGNKILVEASPWDKIWGIGMREESEGIEDPSNWKGLNLLGRAITSVRDVLKEGII